MQSYWQSNSTWGNGTNNYPNPFVSPKPSQEYRLYYIRAKDVGTRTASVDQRNKRIIENAQPLPDGSELKSRSFYWFLTTEEIQLFPEDATLFELRERVVVENSHLTQVHFRLNKTGVLWFKFADGYTMYVKCMSNANKRIKVTHVSESGEVTSDNELELVNNGGSLQNTNNTNRFQHINDQHSISQHQNHMLTPFSEPLAINILLLVPEQPDFIVQAEKALLKLNYQKEVSSESIHLYSQSQFVNKVRNVLVFPCKERCAIAVQEFLVSANDVILLVENIKEEQQSDIMTILRVNNVRQVIDNKVVPNCTWEFSVKAANFDARELDYNSELTQPVQKLFSIDELKQLLSGVICKQQLSSPQFEKLFGNYFDEWSLKPPALKQLQQSIYICFKYEKASVQSFNDIAEASLRALVFQSRDEAAVVVHGSVLVYIRCPACIPWYILLHKKQLFNSLSEEGLIEIYECFIADIEMSMKQPDNEEFMDELSHLMEQMISDGIAEGPTINRFHISAEVQSVATKPENSPKINIQTRSCRKVSVNIVSSAQFTLAEVQGLEKGTDKWTILVNSQSNVVWLENLQPDTIYNIRARVQTTAGWSAWSKEIDLHTMPENSKTAVLKSPLLKQKVLDSIKALENFSIPQVLRDFGIEYLNIAYMGRIGDGKSATFNTMWSIMSGTYSEPQMARNDIVTVTLNISKRFLINNKNNAIRLCDTYGWKGGDSWSTQELELFLNGFLKDGHKASDALPNSLQRTPAIGDCIHAVIIVYELPSVFTESHITMLKSFFHKLNNKGYHPIVILTKPDVIEEAGLGGKLQEIFESGIIDQHIQNFIKNSKIPAANIFPVVNYCDPYSSRDWVLERLALDAFEAAVAIAKVKIANDLKKHILVTNNGKTLGTVTFDGNPNSSLDSVREEMSTNIPFLKSLKLFSFKGIHGALDRGAEKMTTLAQVGKQNNEHGFWQVELIFQTVPIDISESFGTSIPDQLTVLMKNNGPLGIIIFDQVKPQMLSELRLFMLEQLDVQEFQFITTENIGLPQSQEQTALLVQFLHNKSSIVIDNNPIEKEEKPIVVLEKDKSAVGLCFANSSIKLSELRTKLIADDVVTSNFVFLLKGIPLTGKQELFVQLDRITFEHAGETSFCVDYVNKQG